MASQSAGIQQLLQAEKRAAEKVAEARKRKARRLKQAKEEAQAEIEAYRKEREKQFKEHEAEQLGSREDMNVEIEKNVGGKMVGMTATVANNREAVLGKLLVSVYDIKPEIHPNYLKQMEQQTGTALSN